MRPAYYTDLIHEPVSVISAWDLNFNLGNVIKYIARAGKKPGASRKEDLLKAQQYLNFEIDKMIKDEEQTMEALGYDE